MTSRGKAKRTIDNDTVDNSNSNSKKIKTESRDETEMMIDYFGFVPDEIVNDILEYTITPWCRVSHGKNLGMVNLSFTLGEGTNNPMVMATGLVLANKRMYKIANAIYRRWIERYYPHLYFPKELKEKKEYWKDYSLDLPIWYWHYTLNPVIWHRMCYSSQHRRTDSIGIMNMNAFVFMGLQQKKSEFDQPTDYTLFELLSAVTECEEVLSLSWSAVMLILVNVRMFYYLIHLSLFIHSFV